MTELEIPKMLYREIEKYKSILFAVNSGLKQGDALSTLLFNTPLESTCEKNNTETLLFINQGPRTILAFEDIYNSNYQC